MYSSKPVDRAVRNGSGINRMATIPQFQQQRPCAYAIHHKHAACGHAIDSRVVVANHIDR